MIEAYKNDIHRTLLREKLRLHQPWDLHLLNFAFDLGSGILAGLVLAWATKPRM